MSGSTRLCCTFLDANDLTLPMVRQGHGRVSQFARGHNVKGDRYDELSSKRDGTGLSGSEGYVCLAQPRWGRDGLSTGQDNDADVLAVQDRPVLRTIRSLYLVCRISI